ncbi:MAG: ExbD/TolR family protein [Oceanicaulis sp.]
MITAHTDRPDEEPAGAVLTPLVDVVFMLVVFLLLTANAAPFAIEVDAPASENALAQTDADPILIATPDADGAWRIDDRRLHEADAHDLLARLVAEDRDRPVIILTDAHASVQNLIDALDMARGAGAQSVDIAAEPQRAQP